MIAETPRDWLHSPAVLRNRTPILEVLRRFLPETGQVLEIGCGTGEHAVYMARHLPGLNWRPSDIDPYCLETAAARIADARLPNLAAPVELDVTAIPWPVDPVDVVVCINMIHIVPWPVAQALVRGAVNALSEGGVAYLYGPFMVGGRHTAPSNDSFDRMLRRHDPDWGVRDLDALTRVARQGGLRLVDTVDMPSNNLSVFYEKENTLPR